MAIPIQPEVFSILSIGSSKGGRWQQKMDQYVVTAKKGVLHLVSLGGGVGVKAAKAYEKLEREYQRTSHGEVPDASRVREMSRYGREIVAEFDRIIPDVRKAMNTRGYPSEYRVLLRGAERELPRCKDVVNKAVKELEEFKEPVVEVLGNTMTTGLIQSTGTVNVDYKAKSADDEPVVELKITGPEGMPVRIEYEETALSKRRNGTTGLNKRVIRKGSDNSIVPADRLTELVHGSLGTLVRGKLELELPKSPQPYVVKFRTRGLSAGYAFKVVLGNRKPISFKLDITYTAYRFIKIEYIGAQYIGYGSKEASWGLPELKTFIKKFAATHYMETKKKPYIGNKSVQDGVKYDPHNGKSHARGYAVDIDFGVDTGNHKVGEGNYDAKAHKKQIMQYLKCGAKLVYTGNKNIADKMGHRVKYDAGHKSHDHINVL